MNKRQQDNQEQGRKQDHDQPDEEVEGLDGAGDASAPADRPAEEASAEAGSESAAEQVERDLQETFQAVAKERDELEDRLKRTAADFQNFVRRSEQNLTLARDQQLLDVARGLVTVLDHFDRALEVDPEKTSTKDLLAGVVMVRDELLRALQRFGIERLDVEQGAPFDPNRHEALMRQSVEGVESNHVTAQFQPGYMLKDKTIRPAQVGVAE